MKIRKQVYDLKPVDLFGSPAREHLVMGHAIINPQNHA